MTDGTELEVRIHAALDRIAAATDGLSTPTDGPSVEDLNDALEAERTANAQLEERVKAIKEKQETFVDRLERDVAELKEALAVRDGTIQKMRQMNGQLRRNNHALRSANAAGVGDATLINEAMQNEIEALRALQESDRAELDDILSTLEPVLQEASNA